MHLVFIYKLFLTSTACKCLSWLSSDNLGHRFDMDSEDICYDNNRKFTVNIFVNDSIKLNGVEDELVAVCCR